MSNLHNLQGVAIQNGGIVSSRDTSQTRKQENNEDKGYMAT